MVVWVAGWLVGKLESNAKQAGTEVVPSSSLVEAEVEIEVEVGVGVGVGVVRVGLQMFFKM